MIKKEQFEKSLLREIIADDAEGYSVVESNILDTSRWSVYHECVFDRRSDGMMFRTQYSIGATEYQDESPYEYDGDVIEVEVVEPINVVVRKYVPVEI